MEILNAYFGNLLFTKVEQKEGFTVYAAAITSSYGDGKKQFALAFVPVHMGILDKGFLRDLHWQNLQTRLLTNGWRLPSQKWVHERHLPTPMFNIVDRNNVRSKYVCESEPLEMVLLHDPKKKGQNQYHNRMNLLAALTTFRCVINFTEGHERQPTQISSYVSPVRAGVEIQNAVRLDQISPTRISSSTDPSKIPISSLQVRTPPQNVQYRPADVPSDTFYRPRNEGTMYATSTNDGTYSFGGAQSSIGGGYTKMSLDLSPHEASVEAGRQNLSRQAFNIPTRYPDDEDHFSQGRSDVDDSFELLI